MLISYLLFAVGLILIIIGGDYFVDSATWIARVTKLPEVLIGATIVSLATTFPETMVSVISAINNQSAMSVGNAVGSTICNTGLILGLYNLVRPSKISSRIFNFKGLLLILYILIFWYLAGISVIGTWASYMLLFMLVLYVFCDLMIVGYRRSQTNANHMEILTEPSECIRQAVKFIMGISMIIYGSHLLVTHGVTLAKLWGVPASVIALTLIALGTSLPEFVTAVASLVKGHAELSIGNILGANILNITMVMGLSARFRPLKITGQMFYFDIPTSIVINSVLILPSIITKKITRFQSLLLLVIYAVYVAILFH
ncbi:MAG: calcium/sodium antiporter [Caulobacteraceae bacterium]